MSKFYPDDIKQYSQKELVEISLEQHRCYAELLEDNKAKDKRINELEETLKYVHKDLLMRAETDSKGFKVVSVGSGCWESIKKALEQASEVSK